MRAGLALTALVLAGPTQLPARGQQPALPRTGFAIQAATGVVLVDPAGHVVRTLKGYTLRDDGVERAGQVELRDASGHDFELRAGRLAAVPRDSVTLPRGWSVQFSEGWSLQQGGHTVATFPATSHLELDSSGTFLSVVPRGGGATIVRDLRTGKLGHRPAGCRVGARVGAVEYDLCGSPFATGKGSSIVRVDRSGTHVLAKTARGAAGWRALVPGPAGSPLLAQWSGSCTVTAAYLVSRTSGELTPLRDRSARRVEGFGLGWIGTTPFASLPRSTCSASAAPPGIYAYDATGRALLVYRLSTRPGTVVRLWR
ncbi:MAG TPA: hypothetical protein VHD91_12770 [Gaiellaceae bacterium]|nr:hypothetical protein [Gaiellaceae bacterium]